MTAKQSHVRTSRLLVCAKSRWEPPIRREHSLSMAAARAGWDVDMVEQAYDVRETHSYLRREPASDVPSGITLHSYFSPVPGHRGRAAGRFDARLLNRALRRIAADGPAPEAVVVNAPWNWPATSGLARGTRRVLDLGDDWATLLPQRGELIHRLYKTIAAEADEIIVVAPTLADLFERPVTVVPNGVAPELLTTSPVVPPGQKKMTYLGTLSERLDVHLLSEVLRLLPDWSLNLVGPCHYAGLGQQPSAEVVKLVAESGGRARWSGPVGRAEVGSVLDCSDVLILPNVVSVSRGQDSMKLYDYAARGRPIVATPIRLPDVAPSVLRLAESPRDFAQAVAESENIDGSANRTWAESNSYNSRLTAWLTAVAGREPTPPNLEAA